MQLTPEQQLTINCADGTTVTLIDIMGSDAEVSQAARTSYGREAKDRTAAEDFNLLNLLIRHRHTSPVEMAEVKFLLTLPIDTCRQHIRHRTASVSEYSTRYTAAIDDMAAVGGRMWRMQSTANKQGSADAFVDAWPAGWVLQRKWVKSADGSEGGTNLVPPPEYDEDVISTCAYFAEEAKSQGILPWDLAKEARPDFTWPHDWEIWDLSGDHAVLMCTELPYFLTPGYYLSLRESDIQGESRLVYEERLLFKVAREVARKDLCMCNFTRMYWKIDLHNFCHYLGLRMDPHAQFEIREMANAMYTLAKPHFPVILGAWREWAFKAMRFGDLEWDAVKVGVAAQFSSAEGAGVERALTHYTEMWKDRYGYGPTPRQLEELRVKMLELVHSA